jgi:hypothetical protein
MWHVRAAVLLSAALIALTATPRGDASAAVNVPTDADRVAFMRGVIAQREIDIFQNPRACGAVLLRARCQSDTAPAVPAGQNAKAYALALVALEKMLAFTRTGDLSSYDPKLGDANTVGPLAAQEWTRDPRGSWLRSAGVAYVLVTGEDDILHQVFYTDPVGMLAANVADAGPYGSLVPAKYAAIAAATVSSNAGRKDQCVALDPTQAQQLGQLLAPELAKLFPIAADPAIDFSASPSGEARVGVAMSTANELFESPPVLMEPQSRAFLVRLYDFELAHGASVPGWVAARFDRVVSTGQSSAALNALYTAQKQLAGSYIRELPQAPQSALVFGLIAAQGAYNAAVLRDKSFDLGVRRSMSGGFAAEDTVIPEAAASRAAFLADSQPAQWVEENARLSDLTTAIVAAK